MAKLSDLVKSLKKKTGAETASESNIMNVSEWISLGNYAVNRVVSGNIYNGIPASRITTLYGPSGSGKSLLAANAIIDALNNLHYDVVYFFDSEGGGLSDYIKDHGVDMSKIQYIPVTSIEDCAVKMISVYDSLVQAAKEYKDDPENNDRIKALCVLDSIGGMGSDKLISDAVKKDQMVADMGASAKARNNMMRGLMMRVPLSGAALIIINHEYSDPSALFGSSKIHNMAGGLGIQYASHVVVQMSKLLVKSADAEFLTGNESDADISGFYKGNRIKAFCVKNRIVKPNFEATMYVDYQHGISKYDGLIEDAVKYGFIQEVRGGYIVPSYSDKKITYKQLVASKEIWDTFLDKFNEESIKRMSYSNSITEELDKIEADNGIESEDTETEENG